MLYPSYKMSNDVLTHVLLNFELHVNFCIVSSCVYGPFGFNAARWKNALFI